MSGEAASAPCPGWLPSPAQARLLKACVTPDRSWVTFWNAWRSSRGPGTIDAPSQRLLPLIYWKLAWQSDDDPVVQQARAVFLANYAQNLRRLSSLAGVLRQFDDAGIPTLLLKGAALNVVCYASPGLRDMGDVDVLVHVPDVHRAATLLKDAGWFAHGGLDTAWIVADVTRVRHAWSFSRSSDECLDLHWRPGEFCFSPALVDDMWQASRPIVVHGAPTSVMCPTDLLFHACAHGVQFGAVPSIRWIADAMTLLARKDSIDWRRFVALAHRAALTARLHAALAWLGEQVDAPVPPSVLLELAPARSPRWERRELSCHARPAPLSHLARLRRHWWVFKRQRRFDPAWSRMPSAIAFLDYLRVLLSATRLLPSVRRVWSRLAWTAER